MFPIFVIYCLLTATIGLTPRSSSNLAGKKKQVNINEKKRILYIKKIREHSHHNTPLM